MVQAKAVESRVKPKSTEAKKEQPHKTWPLIQRFWPFIRPHKRTLIFLVFILILSLPTGVISPLLVKYLIDTVVKTAQIKPILMIGLALAGLTIFSQILNYIQMLTVRKLHLLVVHRMGRLLFAHLLRLPMAYYSQHDTGYVMSRVRDDLGSLGASMVESFLRLISGFIRALVFTGLLFYLDPMLASTGLILLLVVLSINLLFSKPLRRRARAAQEAYAKASSALHEGITGMTLIKSTVREKFEVRRYVNMMSDVVRASFRRSALGVFSSRTIDLMAELSIYAIILVGAYRIIQGTTTFGNLFAFSLYLTHLYGAASSLMQLNPEWQNTMNSLERVFEIFDTEPEPKTVDYKKPPDTQCAISFENVGFSYDGETPVLHDICVEIPAGSQVALVGPSGAGKSTFAGLVPRFYDPLSGRILLNGHDIREFRQGDLRQLIGIVPQDVFLFDRSIAENIAYGNRVANPALIEEAAQAANAHEFIVDLPEGYNTKIGERGIRLSVGQKQRLAIAREVLRNPAILILDEATSSLDSVSESLIQEALQRLKKNRTWIVIAHRLSTVIESDWILVFHKGRIIEQGTHEQLLARGGFYSILFETQFKRGLVLADGSELEGVPKKQV
ncbi:MAG: ABC transporter ATP-binding protein [Blastocatellia bacterium]